MTVSSDNPGMGWKVTVTAKTGRRNTYEVQSPEYTVTPSENVESVRLEAYQLSGVGNVAADESARVSVNVCGRIIVVEAGDVIESLTVTDVAGRRVAVAAPMTASAQLQVGGSGVYVVEAVLGDGSRTVRKVMAGR